MQSEVVAIFIQLAQQHISPGGLIGGVYLDADLCYHPQNGDRQPEIRYLS